MPSVHLASYLREFAGGSGVVSVEGATVAQVLSALRAIHPGVVDRILDESGAVRQHVNVFVNEVHMREVGGLGARVGEGDRVYILPAVSGGASDALR
ncbi:MAG TPA: ubiquitin-like small modifier protein 1 [Tepidisphaeraceae bacterium]|nr:ubiquitin-like small modifier protein 1 [Tepidisphaeraceae bacterium]